MSYQIPPNLKSGDTVGLIAPAGKINPNDIQEAITIIEEWGYNIEYGQNLFTNENQFAGSDRSRAADMQHMLDAKHVKAIFCARGGYGTIRILQHLDFTKFCQSPKWIIGYSDITVLHSYLLSELKICSLHASMPVNFSSEQVKNLSLPLMNDILSGAKPSITFPGHSLNREGLANGIISGGNLSILYSMRGTMLDIDTKDRILFIEDLGEYLYHIDRIMMNIKLGGKLAPLSALVVGGMSEMKDNDTSFGSNAYDIIAEKIAEYGFPVAFNFPAGHVVKNLPLIIGRDAVLQVSKNGSTLSYK